jgi:hypothetical protein
MTLNSLNIPLIAVSISFMGLIITLLKLLAEQKKYHQIKYTQDKRLEYKLRIHDILVPEILDYDSIVSKFQAQTPMSNVDPIEIRKCIYEMLTEKTIVSFDDGCYTVDTVSEEEEEEEEE